MVALEAGREHERVRATAPREPHRHCAADPERPGLVARGGHHPARSHAPYQQRLAAQLRPVELLDRREEGVHVGMQNDARPAGGGAGAARKVECRHALDGSGMQAELRPREASVPQSSGKEANAFNRRVEPQRGVSADPPASTARCSTCPSRARRPRRRFRRAPPKAESRGRGVRRAPRSRRPAA